MSNEGKKGNSRKTFIMFLLAFLIGFFVVSVVEVIRSSFGPVGPDVQTASAVLSGDATRTPGSFADLAERVKPAVVNISTSKTVRTGPFRMPMDRGIWGDEFFERFFGDMPRREFKQRSLGSGFIISHDGYIFTNNHVVEQADKILVKLSNGREYEARIIGKDVKTDLALIKIKPNDSLPVVEIGDSESVRVGEWVIAIGNPFGLEQTVTAGIVSAKGRVIGAGPYDNFIQTDASINPGNSGGPLFNMEGKVVGINTAIVAQGQGIGFAIPIAMAKTILPDLKSKGKVTRAWLGVSVQDLDETMARSLHREDQAGALIADVFRGDPADKAGLKPGDIVTQVNGKPIKDSHELLMIISTLHVGDRVNVTFVRDGRERTVPVVAAERKDRADWISTRNPAEGLGMEVQEITPDIAKYLGVPKKSGVVVVEVEPGSPADEVGIQPQDIILKVNNVRVASMKDYVRELSRKTGKNSLLFLIKRGKATFFVAIRIS
ncbi:MAG TPA: peptidase [Syntrophus sp. (in: bacteria)]|nr:peptidase [Syntrophus sp. (in: bacteria)]